MVARRVLAALCLLAGSSCARGENGLDSLSLTTLTSAGGHDDTTGGTTGGDTTDDGSSTGGVDPSTTGTSTTTGSTSGADDDETSAGTTSGGGGGPKFDLPPQPDVGMPDQDCGDPELVATIRDFPGSHVDMEAYLGNYATKGIVAPNLGPNQKPQLSSANGQLTDSGSFSQWYQTLAGVNLEFQIVLPLTDNGNGTVGYDDDAFFPIDNMGFGNEGYLDYQSQSHNFHFTTEIHTEFTYQPGQTFTFSGDDDLWMFVDGVLRIDLGGVHPEVTDTLQLDTLGFLPGTIHTIDIFHAERHTDRSNFKVTTSIACFHDPQG